jgi:isopentenyl-diphosphate delta-isomerase
MSRIVIVDDTDTEIAVKEKSEMSPDDRYRVSAIWITNTAGDILLAKRAATKNHDPGKWATAVAGTVEEGEDYLTNAVKEAQEELGLTIAPGELVPGFKHFVARERGGFFCQWYWYTRDIAPDELVLEPWEVADVCWVSEERLREWVAAHPEEFLGNAPRWVEAVLAKRLTAPSG